MSYSRRSVEDRPDYRDVFSFDYGHKPQDSRASSRFDAVAYERQSLTTVDYYRKPVPVNCGELRPRDEGLRVHMTGRVQFQRISKFLALRDTHGSTQLVIHDRPDLLKRVINIPPDSHIEIIGTVKVRPTNTINHGIHTGHIEVYIQELLDIFVPKRKFEDEITTTVQAPDAKKPRTVVPMTSLEMNRCVTNAAKKKYQQRTHHCNELSKNHVNLEVSLSGWIKEKRKDCRFGTLNDGLGSIQVIISRNDGNLINIFKELEVGTSLVNVKGIVQMRPLQQVNPGAANGYIEVHINKIEIIDPNEPDSKNGDDSKSDKDSNVDDFACGSQSSSVPQGGVNSYCHRTHTCGELREVDVGKEVVLYGWLAAVRANRFVLMRDGHGTTQLFVPGEVESKFSKFLMHTPLESVIKATGTVSVRPTSQITSGMTTGNIEVVAKTLEVLNPAKTDLPFVIRDFNKPKENLRMKYRYLALRFPEMQYRLRLRSKVLMKMREFLINHRDFVEVETPTLFRRTPGGAQEFIVPTRMEDKFYSLVQSPQQLKQLLMIGSMDRYFQVARCYRDEGARPDRQPEFTQMDIELSFTDREQIMKLIEDLLQASFPDDLAIHTPFPVIKYHEAMHWYGSDKPDLSFEKKLIDIYELVEVNELPENLREVKKMTAKVLVFNSNCDIEKLTSSIDDCEDVQKLRGDNQAKLFVAKCSDDWKENIKSTLPFLDAEKLKDLVDFPVPCTIVVGIGHENEILPLMGKLRNDMFKKPTSKFHFAWIVDFPLFVEQDDRTLESAHHPFTQPNEQDVDLLESDPLKVRGLHFDLVLNGYEVGGGSVRIHDPLMQIKVLKDVLKIPIDSLYHLMDALASGAPPHGGIALGIDRLLSIMVGADTIREVIAFPKGVDGKDPMCGAPCPISDEEKRLYHLIPRSPK